MLTPSTILLVDDDVDQLSILGAMLSGLPYDIETALDGKRAVEMLEHGAPLLVITDMVMPDISGSEIIHLIRSRPHLKATKIVIITSFLKYVTDEDRAMSNGVILKPINRTDFEQVLTDVLAL